jgi:riboflavin biosynthesis pyrimidine reductase
MRRLLGPPTETVGRSPGGDPGALKRAGLNANIEALGGNSGASQRADLLAEVDLDQAYWVRDPGHQLVTGVMISSVDGAATIAGRSGVLGNSADRRLFATLRAHSDVLLVGSATVAAEHYGGDRPDPVMREVRRRRGLADVPRIALVSKRLDLDPTHPMFSDTLVRPLVLTCDDAPVERRAQLSEQADVVVAGIDTVDLGAALDVLADRGLRRVSCEGGPTLLAAVAAAGRLDELSLTIAPILVGGHAGRITHGAPIGQALTLLSVLEDKGYLFLRYRVQT